MSVNVSARQLARPDLPTVVAAVLARHGLAAERLHLEITEGDLMTDLPTTIRTLEQLRALGVQLAIDGFGTGQTSLRYLERLGAHAVKIDRSFVERATEDGGRHDRAGHHPDRLHLRHGEHGRGRGDIGGWTPRWPRVRYGAGLPDRPAALHRAGRGVRHRRPAPAA